MICKELKEKYLRATVFHAASEPLGFEFNEVSASTREEWFSRLHAVPKATKRATPRLVNRFTLGADPEFIITLPGGSERVDAVSLNLKPGMGFGADQNGRLVEIRPRPSKHALKVLASTLLTMRWMSLLTKAKIAPEWEWQTGAYLHRDGIGGHVHFGRKTPNRKLEIAALDVVCYMMIQAGCFPKGECDLRMAGDALGQRYGQPGDFRFQRHGYEYRTFPSWLDSPWLAYFTLVMSKLAAHDPKLFDVDFKKPVTAGIARQRFLNALAYYQALDDDARLCYHVVGRLGLPTHIGGDFRSRWGLAYQHIEGPKNVELVPPNFGATKSETCALFGHLLTGSALMPEVPEVNWNPKLAKGYRLALDYTNVTRIANLGELLVGMTTHKDLPVQFIGRDMGTAEISVSAALTKLRTKGWKDKLPKGLRVWWNDTHNFEPNVLAVQLSGAARGLHYKATKEFLLSGVFPIWAASKVTDESLAKFMAEVEPEPKDKKPNPKRGEKGLIYRSSSI